jgi:hypothetical protein
MNVSHRHFDVAVLESFLRCCQALGYAHNPAGAGVAKIVQPNF